MDLLTHDEQIRALALAAAAKIIAGHAEAGNYNPYELTRLESDTVSLTERFINLIRFD